MDKWIIRSEPSEADPERRLLLIAGDKRDAQKIVKKFGKVCGRPFPIDEAEGFSLGLPLHRLDEKTLKSLEEFLNGALPRKKIKPALTPRPESAPIPEPDASPLSEPASESETASPLEKEPAIPAPIENETKAAAPEIESFPAPPPLETQTMYQSPAPSLNPQAVPAESSADQAHFGSAVSIPMPAAISLSTPDEILDPLRTFETLRIGPYNRFAHAAAISVVNSQGAMYNPLFIHGPPGSGKTHLAQALAQEFIKNFGEKSVLFTSGWKLFVFALAAADGSARTPWLDERMSHLKILVLEDIHLLALTENAQGFLEKMISSFLEKGRQLVVTAVYPPRALESLSHRIKVPFASGQATAVELKPSPAMIQLEILKDFLKTRDMEISDEESKIFLERVAAAPYENYRWTRRLTRLLGLGISLGQHPQITGLIAPLFDLGTLEADKTPESSDLAKARDFLFPKGKEEALPICWFFPKGQESLVPWTQMRFFQTMGDMGIVRSYRNLPPQSYDQNQPMGLPFKIGEICRRLAPRAAVFLGPPEKTPLGGKETEWMHATSHILAAMGIPSAYIPYRGLKVYGSFLRAHLDLLP